MSVEHCLGIVHLRLPTPLRGDAFPRVVLALLSAQETPVTSIFKVPLVLTPQPEGGYTVTSPVLPELLTEGDTVEEAVANVNDALDAVLELYEDQGRDVPANLRVDAGTPAI